MALFAKAALDPDFEQLTVSNSKFGRKVLANAQVAIRQALLPGEQIKIVAVDSLYPNIGVVTNQRLLTFRKAKLDLVVEPSRISQTRLGSLPNGSYLAFVDGVGYQLRVLTSDEANAFVAAIDHYLLRR